MDRGWSLLCKKYSAAMEVTSVTFLSWATASLSWTSFHSRYDFALVTPTSLTSSESPRYLAQVGKNEEAWEVLRRIHHNPNDHEDSACHAEYTQIVRQVEFEGQQGVSYLKMFTVPSWRRRSLFAFFIQYVTILH
jgi:Sugar (and other) transporter